MVLKLASKKADIPKPPFALDPGAFNAALFEAYAGKCGCSVCRILRRAVKTALKPYLPRKAEEEEESG